MNLFERQRLRVLPLVEDRTRAGAAPSLAVELDSKRWHETGIALDDVDGDGLDDLLAVFPEGLSGSDLIAQWWRGSGEGRFESKARRSDVKGGGEAWIVVTSDVSPPAILLLRDGNVELRPFAPAGKKALAEPSFRWRSARSDSLGAGGRRSTVGTGGEKVEVRNVPPNPSSWAPSRSTAGPDRRPRSSFRKARAATACSIRRVRVLALSSGGTPARLTFPPPRV